MDQETLNIKIPKTSEKTRRKKKTNTDHKKKMKEEKWKRHLIRTRMVFPVKKMTSVISGVFSRKKTLAGENRGKRDGSSEEITEADETLSVGKAKPKQNLLQKKESFWESARVRLKILILGRRLRTRKRRRRRRRRLNEGIGEDELCKKRILMGERCKPINRSGILQYDGDGILLPEP
ncbi:hypothetical protein EUTSA_v10005673mg [Eutrema salsugineum]|uniref:Uncharacterized protein n=1 Tax=Eutrema salsugineum TaxID=72664 RepID=V4KXT1_EUTSA|nr:uncharacterized protein LOC18012492 [Eutrema salsugineum]ESQ32213.1 hypothetical protein EUTSA_v10005673mg [Eutrema salsugineum]